MNRATAAFALGLSLAATAAFAHEAAPIRCTITLQDRGKDGFLIEQAPDARNLTIDGLGEGFVTQNITIHIAGDCAGVLLKSEKRVQP